MVLLDVEGAVSPPRDNGELVFGEPWESRAFGMVATLADAGTFTWDEFRDHLVARIAGWEATHAPGDPSFRYYRCWLGALEDVLVARGRLRADDVTERSGILASRPAGHDHEQAGQHGHGH